MDVFTKIPNKRINNGTLQGLVIFPQRIWKYMKGKNKEKIFIIINVDEKLTANTIKKIIDLEKKKLKIDKQIKIYNKRGINK